MEPTHTYREVELPPENRGFGPRKVGSGFLGGVIRYRRGKTDHQLKSRSDRVDYAVSTALSLDRPQSRPPSGGPPPVDTTAGGSPPSVTLGVHQPQSLLATRVRADCAVPDPGKDEREGSKVESIVMIEEAFDMAADMVGQPGTVACLGGRFPNPPTAALPKLPPSHLASFLRGTAVPHYAITLKGKDGVVSFGLSGTTGMDLDVAKLDNYPEDYTYEVMAEKVLGRGAVEKGWQQQKFINNQLAELESKKAAASEEDLVGICGSIEELERSVWCDVNTSFHEGNERLPTEKPYGFLGENWQIHRDQSPYISRFESDTVHWLDVSEKPFLRFLLLGMIERFRLAELTWNDINGVELEGTQAGMAKAQMESEKPTSPPRKAPPQEVSTTAESDPNPPLKGGESEGAIAMLSAPSRASKELMQAAAKPEEERAQAYLEVVGDSSREDPVGYAEELMGKLALATTEGQREAALWAANPAVVVEGARKSSHVREFFSTYSFGEPPFSPAKRAALVAGALQSIASSLPKVQEPASDSEGAMAMAGMAKAQMESEKPTSPPRKRA